jgi:tetratricopeptide (TPR) repeat protein
MYAGSAFIIIQVESSLADPLNLPRWVGTLIVIILSAGFPVTAVLAWIFDLTSEGITKTESYEESEGKEIIKAPARRRLKASDVAMAVMAVVIVILAWPKIFRGDAVKRLGSSGGKLSIAVMPFKNMTNDTNMNVWQEGIQQRLISSLSNSGELQVRHRESVQSLLQTEGLAQLASLSPSTAGTVSEKLAADIFVFGSILKSGGETGLDAQLIDTRTKEVIKSFEVMGPSGDSLIFPLADSLRNMVRNFLLIKKLIKENPMLRHYQVPTNSPEALSYLIYGANAREKGDFASGVTWGLKALAADSTFADAAFMIENSYSAIDSSDKSKEWLIRNYNKRDQMTNDCQIYASWAYAYSFESYEAQARYLNMLLEIDDEDPGTLISLGMTYNLAGQYDKTIPVLEKSLKILHKWGNEYLVDGTPFYQLVKAYYHSGQYDNVKKKLKEWGHHEKYWLNYWRALLSFADKDTIAADQYISKFTSEMKSRGTDAFVAYRIASLYMDAGMPEKAEDNYQKAISLEPDNPDRLYALALAYITNNRNLNEVTGLMDKAMGLAKNKVDYYEYLNTKGWALFKQGMTKEAYEILQKTWSETPFKIYSIRSHYEEVKKAAEGQGIV